MSSGGAPTSQSAYRHAQTKINAMSPAPLRSRLRNRRAAEQHQRAAGPNRPTTRSRPPYNPGLHKLVAEKQEWAEPLDAEAKARGFLGWHQRGYLPHYDAPGTMQLVTFRLDDALPASRRSEWAALMNLEDNRERRRKLEAYVDQGRGECWLRQRCLAQLTESALRFFAGERYRLAAWVVMPNHVHVLVEVWQAPLAELVKSWKQFIARRANRVLGREGTFWAREYWETRIVDETHQIKAARYVEANPVKAGLVREAEEWPWSSARFRDTCGRLTMPAGAPTFGRLTAAPSPKSTP